MSLTDYQRHCVKVLAAQGADSFWVSGLVQQYFAESIDVEINAIFADIAAAQALVDAQIAAEDAAELQRQEDDMR